MSAEATYIVIGAGSAGCALAGRLSEDPDASVVLFEAGKRNDSLLVRWPAGFARLQNARNRWEWETTAQAHCGGRHVPTPQGKLVGGGSAVNGMVYIRGNPRDYDGWADAGATGWGYRDVLPFFRKAEDNMRFADDWHGTGGPLGVSDQISPSPLTRLFVLAGQETGHRHNPDFNGAHQAGVGFYQVTQRAGQRCSSAHAYLYPVLDRPNLRLETRVQVTRVLIEHGRAVGIEYLRDGATRPERLMAQREVILSAGAINSAKLLMLSGIGPADDLSALGIDPVHHLPGVGHNLHDHVDAYVCVRINAPISYTGQERGLAAIRHGLEYLLFKSGAVTSNACEGGLFASSDGNEDWPDIQLHFMPVMLPSHQMIDGHGVTVLCSALRPRSRGQLRLASADPRRDPLIDTNFLADPDDLRVNIAALRVGRAVMNAPSFRKLHGGEVFPGTDLVSDTDLGNYVRAFAKTDYHPVGTCRMGTDPMAVVDPALRVHGMDGLRVADASIMPAIVSGNTNAPSIMIGERAAQFVRDNAPATP